MKRFLTATVALLTLTASSQALDFDLWGNPVQVHGSFQTNMLFPEKDDKIGSDTDDGKFNTNTYLDLWIQGVRYSAGLRLEYLEHPLPGFDAGFKGWGLPYFYLKVEPVKGLEITGGDFYEQFGSGIIFRAYEDRALGIDNAVRGGRLRVTSLPGITFKALGGVQRRYWHWDTDSWIAGADIEADLAQWWKGMAASPWRWSLGAGWLFNHQDDEDIIVPGQNYRLNLPHNINAFDGRTRVTYKGFNLYGEYAYRTQSPSSDNNFTYGSGNAAMLELGWTGGGKTFSVQARRSENMANRFVRKAEGNSGFINNLPPFTTQHSYALPALYPYATQLAGEWAFQGEAAVQFKRNTPLGGKYGTRLRFNASLVYSLPNEDKKMPMGSNGASSPFFKTGDLVYRDVNVMIEKRLSRPLTVTAMYMNQLFDMTAIQGEGDRVHANIFVGDVRWSITPKTVLRGEVQYLTTKQDDGDWLYGMAELTLANHWTLSASDMWNTGVTNVHYYQFGVTGSYGAHRFNVAYGRTRAGFDCSGGVCRWVPATRGFTLAYNYSF